MQTRFTELEKTKNFVKTKVLESAALLVGRPPKNIDKKQNKQAQY